MGFVRHQFNLVIDPLKRNPFSIVPPQCFLRFLNRVNVLNVKQLGYVENSIICIVENFSHAWDFGHFKRYPKPVSNRLNQKVLDPRSFHLLKVSKSLGKGAGKPFILKFSIFQRLIRIQTVLFSALTLFSFHDLLNLF